MKLVKSERGITLVEVLAAVVILTIILGSIMNFFPQMAVLNNTNGDKSQAINTAKQVLNQWQNDDGVQNFLASSGKGAAPTIGIAKNPNPITFSGTSTYKDFAGTYYHFGSTTGNFLVDIYINQTPEKPAYSGTGGSNVTQAYLIKVQVSNTKGTILAETYGYITF